MLSEFLSSAEEIAQKEGFLAKDLYDDIALLAKLVDYDACDPSALKVAVDRVDELKANENEMSPLLSVLVYHDGGVLLADHARKRTDKLAKQIRLSQWASDMNGKVQEVEEHVLCPAQWPKLSTSIAAVVAEFAKVEVEKDANVKQERDRFGKRVLEVVAKVHENTLASLRQHANAWLDGSTEAAVLSSVQEVASRGGVGENLEGIDTNVLSKVFAMETAFLVCYETLACIVEHARPTAESPSVASDAVVNAEIFNTLPASIIERLQVLVDEPPAQWVTIVRKPAAPKPFWDYLFSPFKDWLSANTQHRIVAIAQQLQRPNSTASEFVQARSMITAAPLEFQKVLQAILGLLVEKGTLTQEKQGVAKVVGSQLWAGCVLFAFYRSRRRAFVLCVKSVGEIASPSIAVCPRLP